MEVRPLTDAELVELERLDYMVPDPPWHAGHTVGRTVYDGDGPDDCIGVMDTRRLGAYVAAARNALPSLLADARALRRYARHDADCGAGVVGTVCTCGLAQALGEG